MNKRQQLGRKGEDYARDYLIHNGYNLLRERYRTAQGEIDIIAVQGKTLVFIEVKTRTSINFGWPAEAVDYRKQNRIRKAALAFLQEGNYKYSDFRFDVISILLTEKNQYQLEHIKNAF